MQPRTMSELLFPHHAAPEIADICGKSRVAVRTFHKRPIEQQNEISVLPAPLQ